MTSVAVGPHLQNAGCHPGRGKLLQPPASPWPGASVANPRGIRTTCPGPGTGEPHGTDDGRSTRAAGQLRCGRRNLQRRQAGRRAHGAKRVAAKFCGTWLPERVCLYGAALPCCSPCILLLEGFAFKLMFSVFFCLFLYLAVAFACLLPSCRLYRVAPWSLMSLLVFSVCLCFSSLSVLGEATGVARSCCASSH